MAQRRVAASTVQSTIGEVPSSESDVALSGSPRHTDNVLNDLDSNCFNSIRGIKNEIGSRGIKVGRVLHEEWRSHWVANIPHVVTEI